MRHLTILSPDIPGRLIAEHPNVVGTTVTGPGVLVVTLAVTPGSGMPNRIAYAPGYWGQVQEMNDDPPAASSPAAGAADDPATIVATPPVVPGDMPQRPMDLGDMQAVLQPLGEVEWQPVPKYDRPMVPWAGADYQPPKDDRLAVALSIVCQCSGLRCQHVLNPPTRGERHWWKVFSRDAEGSAAHRAGDVAEPRKQCVYENGHDESIAHHWEQGVWLYGPSLHHPRCPRHPDNYNRPGSVPMPGEGQAATPGITPTATVSVPVPATYPAAYDQPVARDADPVLIRPYTDPARHGEEVNSVVRERFNVCGVVGPDTYPFTVWCTFQPDHGGDFHEMERPGGERLSWPREGATVG